MIKEEKLKELNNVEWYNPNQLLSYNGFINFSLGGRGIGKTYSSKMWCVRDFLKTGRQFVYVRRYKEEFKKKQFWFDAIKKEFPDTTFKIDGMTAYINDKVAGHFIVLSSSQKEKSNEYPLVNKIIFDEFIVDKGMIRYLPNEVETFLDVVETCDRERDTVRCVLLANAVSMVNPYFTYWNIRVNSGERFTVAKDGLVVVEMCKSESYQKMKEKTRMGRLIKGTAYGDYSLENKFLRDDSTFICPEPKQKTFVCCFKFDNEIYGLWCCDDSSIMYFNKKYQPNTKRKYTLTKKDHSPNFLLLRGLKDSYEIKKLMYAYENGLLWYSDMQVKTKMYELMSYFITR